MNLIRFAVLALPLVVLAPAQPNATVAIMLLEGTVHLDGKTVERPVALNGDGVVRTEAGRAAIRLRTGTVFLGENSSIRVLANQPYNFNRLEILNGSAVVVTEEGAGLVACEDTVNLSDHGIFRFDLIQDGCRFRVYEGAATAQLASIAVALRAGKTMKLNRQCGDMIPWNDFDLNEIDSLDRWARAGR